MARLVVYWSRIFEKREISACSSLTGRAGSGADFMAGKMFAAEHHWIKEEGDATRLAEAGLAEM
jgi:hypothetical protein